MFHFRKKNNQNGKLFPKTRNPDFAIIFPKSAIIFIHFETGNIFLNILGIFESILSKIIPSWEYK